MPVKRKYTPGISKAFHQTMLMIFVALTMIMLFMKIMFF
ncbi:hypothetical protein CLV42_12543 [Chitinophaga ginsengisoli]|uniref:Uncharacterized protein n=1 Tax=Chitinophaga ginsengisoli TaxID=363837 RepID=A0A2P8FF48_9BACT|nr:hypothetical protein CLV42_12543 [Chitinophaga ginsengisoli]